MQSGRTTFGGETGPTPASQGHGDTIKQSFCDPMDLSHCNTGIRQVKPFTGRTLCVSKKIPYTICDVGHPHEMIFLEPFHVFLDEMIGNQDDCLAFELQGLPGVSKVTISVDTLFSLTNEISAKLFGHILWENVRGVDGWITGVKHTQILFLFGGSVNLYFMTRLLLSLTAGRIVFFCIGSCGIAPASVTLFERESGVGSGTRCTVHKGFFSFFLGLLA